VQAGGTQSEPEVSVAQAEALPLMAIDLDLADHLGRKRHGRAVLLRRWPAEPELPSEDEDFHIVLLSEPPDGPIAPAGRVVVGAPAKRLSATRKTGEEVATYSAARAPRLKLSPKDFELLRQGRLFAATPLEHSAEDVFAEGKANLTLLARDVLDAEAMGEHLERIAVALAAPHPATPASHERLDDLRALIEDARALETDEETPEVGEALDRLAEVASADGAEQLLAAVARTYPSEGRLVEDVFTLRALIETPEAARDLFQARRFLQRAAIPAGQPDLAMDRSLVLEQLNAAALVTEPERLVPARSALESFRRKYAKRYREHHTAVWQETARLHTELLETRPRADALRRINTLAELGPPLGIGGLAAYDELLSETSGCELIAGVEEIVKTEAVCPACGITLYDPPPARRVREVTAKIERACHKQLARLSSAAVQQVLRGSSEPQIERFLRMVQASQLTDLCEIMDEELAGYLRRFLVETRIQEALEPILSELQHGNTPRIDEASGAMRKVTQALQKAFEATQRALPPGQPPAGPARRSHRKR
jgi:hypothetical protein